MPLAGWLVIVTLEGVTVPLCAVSLAITSTVPWPPRWRVSVSLLAIGFFRTVIETVATFETTSWMSFKVYVKLSLVDIPPL